MTFADYVNLQGLENIIKHSIPVAASTKPFVSLLDDALANLDVALHDGGSPGGGLEIGQPQGTNQFIEHPFFDLGASQHELEALLYSGGLKGPEVRAAHQIINLILLRRKVDDRSKEGKTINILVDGAGAVYNEEVVVLQIEGPASQSTIRILYLLEP